MVIRGQLKTIGGLAALLAFGALLLAGAEYRRNCAGPPFGGEAARREGRAWLGRLERGMAVGEAGVDSLAVGVECRAPGRRALHMALRIDRAGRSGAVSVAGADGGRFHFDGASELLTVTGGAPSAGLVERLRALVPSVVFWSLVPVILDDPRADVWLLPAPDSPAGVRRLAVRWPSESDWFVFDVDTVDTVEARIRGVEFIDARLPRLYRWRARCERPGAPGSGGPHVVWRFSPAWWPLRALTAGRDLMVLTFSPAG